MDRPFSGYRVAAAACFCLVLVFSVHYAFGVFFKPLAAAFGLGYGGLATAHSPLVAWLFGMKQHGRVFGLSFNGWTVGCAAGPLAAGGTALGRLAVPFPCARLA